MNDPADLTYRIGLPEPRRREAARLYLEAFERKLGPILGRDERAEAFLAAAFRPTQALLARAPDGALIGVVGFHDESGGFVGGSFASLRARYGLIGAAWRSLALSLFERAPGPGVLLLDGIVVAPTARGRGVGGALLAEIASYGRAVGAHGLQLDVVDANPRARKLYEAFGFEPTRVSRHPIIGAPFGFAASTTMRFTL